MSFIIPSPLRNRGAGQTMRNASHSDDELMARLLIDTWTLTTGRTLREAPLDKLTEQELIDLWADDHAVPDTRQRSRRRGKTADAYD
jgi:hypothetical protein